MATRKTKRYSDGGDVMDRLMGTSSGPFDGPGRGTNEPEPIRVDPSDGPGRGTNGPEPIKPLSGNQSGPANMAAMMGQAQKANELEGMAGALRGAMASMPSRGRKMGNRMGGMAKGGSVSSASNRGDGIAQRGKTRGKMC